VHPVAYLLALVVLTVWYGSWVTILGLLPWPHHPGGFFDWVARVYARQLLSAAGVEVRIEGIENVAPEGPQIIACNHQSFFDILVVMASLPVRARFVAKKELFRVPFFGWAIHFLGHIRLDRQNRKQAFAAYEIAAETLVQHRMHVVVFPEGTRSRSGLLLPFKKGPAVLAIAAGVTVVPCYCAGTFDILPKGSIRVRPHPVQLLFGPPLDAAGLTYDDRDAFTERLYAAVAALRARSVDATFTPA
jgi:1-acyl-sn-glycerol-3-phosphate acyltransferase